MSAIERIALFDDDGQVIGGKERARAYAVGDRVGLVFVWAAWRDRQGKIQMLLQTRSRPDDPYLGSLDSPAGGHIQEGERHAETARREFAEEVGLVLDESELLYLGQLKLDDPQQGYWRRAMQFFYLCKRPIKLEETVFNEEVQAFVLVELEDFAALVEGRVQSIAGQTRSAAKPDQIESRAVNAEVFSAYSAVIMDAIRRSAHCLQIYFSEGRIASEVWGE